ncbi:MAG: hypothetical protein DRP19_00710 [Thermotogae bacterium]|nr:hypothetical protein [Thermotogaceae bacterium]RKX37752.1 MAG: hypothetical protein DRP19_00710 [Thermotogota bacterium]
MRNHMLILLFNICVIASAMFLALTVHSLFAVIGLGVFLFPLLRMANILRDLDERERALDGLSAKIALGFSMTIALLAVALKIDFQSRDVFVFFLFPLIAKASIFFALAKPRETVMKYVGRTLVCLYLFFVILSHGVSLTTLIESLPGLGILALVELSIKWRWLSTAFFVLAVLISPMFLENVDKPGAFITFVILITPMLVMGSTFFKKEE